MSRWILISSAGVSGKIAEEHRREFQKVKRKFHKYGHEIARWRCKCEISLRSHKKPQHHQAYVEAGIVGQCRMHCLDQNKLHQLDSESRLKAK
jgi:hypothetical protein